MVCPQCGSQTPTSGGRCPVCRAQLPAQGPAVAAATLTPVPPGGGQAEPRLKGTPPPSDAETRLSDVPPAAPASGSGGPLAVGAPFGGRYRILGMLGAGGMGVVYKAWDEELGVAVALKVIRPDVMADPLAAREVERRFKRELLLARQVTHRNVVRIHDLGEVDGIKYITMPFIEGETLATLLASNRTLPVARALAIAREIADGLSAAHEAGVVHRDLKPENVMIEADGGAVIMDFGISRSVSGTGAGTALGAVIGTLEYMSPEQAKGQPVDHRSDIYSFGLMLYDMLLGRHRFGTGESAVAEMMRRMHAPPAALRSIDAGLPESLECVIDRCLQPDPDKRYRTTAELVADLARLGADGRPRPQPRRMPAWLAIAAGALVLALALVAGWLALRPGGAPAPAAARDPVSVLIADFENATGDPVFEGSLEQSLAIGIEGASFVTSYRRDLARRIVEGIKAGSALDQAGATLVAVREGIKVVVAGSIAADGPGYQITVNAVDPASGRPLFAASASAGNKADVLRAVGTLASNVRAQLGDTAPERASLAAETFTAGSLEAMRAYSEAQTLSRGRDAEAVEHYRLATKLDPAFGRAYAGWAISASRLGRRDEAAEQWKKALSLLDRMTEREKYRTLGGYALDFTGNYEQAVEHYSTLVQLYPADEAAHANLALAYFFLLNFAQALEEGRRAVDIYPSDVRFRNNLALYAMYAGDFGAAAGEATKVLEQDPAFHKAYLPLAAAALAEGDFAAAGRAYDGMAGAGSLGASLAALGQADAALYQGRAATAIDVLTAGIVADEKTGNRSALARKQVAMAEALAAQGRMADALRVAQRAIEASESDAVVVPVAGLLIDAGRPEQALRLAAGLGSQLSPQSRAYAKLVEGRAALARGDTVKAVDALRAGLKLADLWLLRFHLGVAYVQAGQIHAAAALAELETCLKRRGEATAVFLDDVPTVRYLAPVHYWLGRAQEDIGLRATAEESYKTFLTLRPEPTRDSLAADAARRAGR